jgi:branched-chain amino acid transport system permease protein
MALKLLGVLAIGIAIPFLTNDYTQYVVNICLVYIISAIGLNIVLGYAGQLSFAHSAFMGIGAYTTAVLMLKAGLSFLLALLLGGLLASVVGLLVGLPAVRVRGLYLALVTIAQMYAVSWVLVHWDKVTLGANGLSVPSAAVFGFALATEHARYVVLFPVTVVMVLLAVAILTSSLGRAFLMVRDIELAAACNGLNVMLVKALAFMISAFFAGIAGGLFAVCVGYLVPRGFGLPSMINQFAMVLLGGMGSITGSVIGAVFVSLLPELLRNIQWAQEVAYGVLMILVLVFMPGGIAGMLRGLDVLPRLVMVSPLTDKIAKRPAVAQRRVRLASAETTGESPL